jgi:hypothetical protein
LFSRDNMEGPPQKKPNSDQVCDNISAALSSRHLNTRVPIQTHTYTRTHPHTLHTRKHPIPYPPTPPPHTHTYTFAGRPVRKAGHPSRAAVWRAAPEAVCCHRLPALPQGTHSRDGGGGTWCCLADSQTMSLAPWLACPAAGVILQPQTSDVYNLCLAQLLLPARRLLLPMLTTTRENITPLRGSINAT